MYISKSLNNIDIKCMCLNALFFMSLRIMICSGVYDLLMGFTDLYDV